MELHKLYFYTSTIKDWLPILGNNKVKMIILDSLKYLTDNGKIKIYGFVIMPNHIHLIWESIRKNGKELPHSSFMKFTAHKIIEHLKTCDSGFLKKIEVDYDSRAYNLWQEKPMATELYSPEVIYQKLDYIHNNPVQGKWMLADSPIDYKYSSAKFYEDGFDDFDFLYHIGEKI